MSGTMMPPGGMPQQGAPQIPPQVLQMLMQRMQGGGMQGGPPPGPQMPPPSMQGPMGPPNTPNPGQGGMPPQGMQGPPPPIPQPGMQQMAAQGRNGDSLVAHLTPGEITIPPQIQTPQLMAVLREAFARAGVSPQQFTAGSPRASRNPATGAPEFNILSSLLPILGGIAGMALAPYTGGLSVPASAAIGGGLGGAASGLMNGQQAPGVLMSALGGAAGGYIGAPTGGLGAAGAEGLAGAAGGGEAMTGATEAGLAGNAATTAAAMPEASALSGAGAAGAKAIAPNPFSASGIGDTLKNFSSFSKPGIYAGIGSSVGGMLAPNATDPLPAGFNKPLGPLNSNFNQLRGSGQVSAPQFGNYNPYSAVAGPNPGYNFFPQATG